MIEQEEVKKYDDWIMQSLNFKIYPKFLPTLTLVSAALAFLLSRPKYTFNSRLRWLHSVYSWQFSNGSRYGMWGNFKSYVKLILLPLFLLWKYHKCQFFTLHLHTCYFVSIIVLLYLHWCVSDDHGHGDSDDHDKDVMNFIKGFFYGPGPVLSIF